MPAIKTVRNRQRGHATKKVRDRQPNILDFETSFNFSKRYVRYDKLEVNFDIATVVGENQRDAIVNHFARIASTSSFLRLDGRASNTVLIIRTKRDLELHDGLTVEPLLFSGKLLILPLDNGSGYKVRAFININPTRYFTHNAGRRLSDAPYEKLQINEAAEVEAKMLSFGVNDNFIRDEHLDGAYLANWNAITREYLDLIRRKIQEEMRSAENNAVAYSYNDSLEAWTLKHAEYYWEYKTKDDEASDLAESFCEHLKTRFLDIKQSYHLNAADFSYDSVSYIFQTSSKNITIAIYAKAHNRIRIECRFSKNPKEMYSSEFRDKGFTSDDESQLFLMLEELTKKVQSKCEIIKTEKELFEPNKKQNPTHLASILAGISHEANNNTIYYARMIRCIRSSKKIIETDDNNYNSFLRRLERRGILKKVKKQKGKPRMYFFTLPCI